MGDFGCQDYFSLIEKNTWNWNRDLITETELKVGTYTVGIHVALSIVEANILLLFELMTRKTTTTKLKGDPPKATDVQCFLKLPENALSPQPHFKTSSNC